jgi:GST-like protein
MIDLYAMGSPNVVKIYIALEELELRYREHPVDAFAGEQFDDAFRRLNPNAKVPVIVDEDGPDGDPYTVFESGAILIYLAEKTGRLLPREGTARYDALQWLMVQMTGVGPMCGQLVHFTRFAPPGNEYGLSRYRTQVRTLLDTLDRRLGETRYLGGDDYTMADVATYPWIIHDVPKALVGDRHAHLARWIDEITQRPAVARALAAAAEVRTKVSAFTDVTDDQLDRFLARGRYALD